MAMRRAGVWAGIILVWLWAGAAEAGPDASGHDVTEMSIEELMNVEVISASKKPEQRWQTAAALYVLTQEDIRRSGVTTIPDALRLVPGVFVAKIDANKWAVSVRGFSGRFTNKLLVLIDGRSVYTPLFAGVYWDVQDTLLEDIDRIEVIRGPGGTLWGANAVNGVINIITKHAKDTQGGLITAGSGTEERGFGGVRYGGKIGEKFFYRAYGKYFDRDKGFSSDRLASDGWAMARGGIRTDWEPTTENKLTLQGDWYGGNADQLTTRQSAMLPATSDLSGGNVLGRWNHVFTASSDATTQFYYDRTDRRETTIRFDDQRHPALALLFEEVRDTIDVDFQHHFALPWRQSINWGFGYRLSSDALSGELTEVLGPGRNDQLFSGFLQDEIWLIEDRLRFTAGTKLEHNDYSDFEWQPSARLLWTPATYHAVWTAVSRGVRSPSRAGDEIVVTLPLDPRAIGGRSRSSEKLLAAEAGYQSQPLKDVFLAFAGYYNLYDDLSSLESGKPFVLGTGEKVFPLVIRNKLRGDVYGAEVSLDYQPLKWWSLRAAYSYLKMKLDQAADSQDPISQSVERASPHHQFSLRSFVDLPGDVEFDTVARYVDNLPIKLANQPYQRTGSYLTLDVHVAYQLVPGLELALVGQNLASDHHQEFKELIPTIAGTEVQRSVYGKVTWRF